MMSTVENPQLSVGQLNSLEERIKNNTASSEDYLLLDNYLFFISNEKYIADLLHKNRVHDYEDFIYQRKTSANSEINVLVGSMLGVVSVLRKFVTGKL